MTNSERMTKPEARRRSAVRGGRKTCLAPHRREVLNKCSLSQMSQLAERRNRDAFMMISERMTQAGNRIFAGAAERVIRHSDFFRVSSFVIRICSPELRIS